MPISALQDTQLKEASLVASKLTESLLRVKQLEEELIMERKQRERAQTLAEALAEKVRLSCVSLDSL